MIYLAISFAWHSSLSENTRSARARESGAENRSSASADSKGYAASLSTQNGSGVLSVSLKQLM